MGCGGGIAIGRGVAEGDMAQAPNWAAAVSDRWKLVLSPQEVPWLLDLEKDWKELENVAAKNPERVKEMAAALKAWFKRTGDPAVGDEKWKEIFAGIQK